MKTSVRLKTALLAAASLTAAATVAHAADGPPTEPVATEHVLQLSDHNADKTATPGGSVKAWTIAGIAAAALTSLARLIGFRKIAAATHRGAEAVIDLSARAARVVARAVSSPFRFATLTIGLGVFALAGLGLYDVEWAGGLIAGLLIAASVILRARSVRKSFSRDPVPARR